MIHVIAMKEFFFFSFYLAAIQEIIISLECFFFFFGLIQEIIISLFLFFWFIYFICVI